MSKTSQALNDFKKLPKGYNYLKKDIYKRTKRG